MLLIGIPCRADATFQLNASALLHDVGSFVGRGVEAGGFRERDLISLGVGLCAQLCRRSHRWATNMAANPGEIVIRTE